MAERVFLKEGYVPLSKGHIPSKVQGGYIPTVSAVPPAPPKGGSAVKAPPK